MSALTERIIRKQEARLGAPLDYLRTIASASTAAFVKFGLFAPLAAHRQSVSASAWHLARLAATQVQDCGTCVQIVVHAARADGVLSATLQAVLDHHLDRCSEAERVAYAYGHAVASQADDVLDHVARVRETFGEDGLVDLALGVATAQVFPVLKRGLGQAVACSLVQVDV